MALALTSTGRFVDAFGSDDRAANWTIVTGDWTIGSGTLNVTPGISGSKIVYYKNVSAGDQRVDVVVKHLYASQGSNGIQVRYQSQGAINCYRFYRHSNGTSFLIKVVGGTSTTLASATNASIGLVVGDTLSLSVSGTGSGTRLTVYRNGGALSGFTDVNPSVADGVLSTGYGCCYLNYSGGI